MNPIYRFWNGPCISKWYNTVTCPYSHVDYTHRVKRQFPKARDGSQDRLDRKMRENLHGISSPTRLEKLRGFLPLWSKTMGLHLFHEEMGAGVRTPCTCRACMHQRLQRRKWAPYVYCTCTVRVHVRHVTVQTHVSRVDG